MLDAPKAPALPAARTVELSISGMTCTACAARVEKKLTRIGPGVVAAVSFATEQATVTAPETVPAQVGGLVTGGLRRRGRLDQAGRVAGVLDRRDHRLHRDGLRRRR